MSNKKRFSVSFNPKNRTIYSSWSSWLLNIAKLSYIRLSVCSANFQKKYFGYNHYTDKLSYLFLSLQYILQDEKNQVLTTNVWFDQEWHDELLKWNPQVHWCDLFIAIVIYFNIYWYFLVKHFDMDIPSNLIPCFPGILLID